MEIHSKNFRNAAQIAPRTAMKKPGAAACSYGLFSVFFTVLTVALLLSFNGRASAAQDSPYNVPPSFADLADQVKHSVVNISTTRVVKGSPLAPFFGPDSPFRDFFGDDLKRYFGDMPQKDMKTQSLGSGFIIDEDGLILTNNHVVEKAEEIKVLTDVEKEYEARVVGRDPKTDLALIRVKPDASFPKPGRLGDSDAIRVGDWIMAVGNPFGLGHTVTTGIIGAKGRVLGAGPYDDFLQTDAAINPGNSGGPLFNMKGEAVGVSTAIVAQAQGIGFAIPINLARQLLPQLKTGKVIRGWLGIAIQDITPDLAQALQLKSTTGVLVADVVGGGPAEQAGVQRGDVVVSLNGKSVENAHELSSMVAVQKPGSQGTLTVVRDGKSIDIPVTIGTMPDEPAKAMAGGESLWGISVRSLTAELAKKHGFKSDDRGVIVTEIEPGSPAADSRLRPGDLIVEANRHKIEDVSDFRKVAGSEERNLLLLVKRGESTFFVALKKTAPGGG